MKIQKSVTTVEEVEIQLPAYYREHKNCLYKINEDETIDYLSVNEQNCLYIENHSSASKIVAMEPSTEAEWTEQIIKLQENVNHFCIKHGVYYNGSPLPQPEDYPNENGNEIKRDESLIES